MKIGLKKNLVAVKNSSESSLVETLLKNGRLEKLNTQMSVKRLQYIRSNALTSVKKEIILPFSILRRR